MKQISILLFLLLMNDYYTNNNLINIILCMYMCIYIHTMYINNILLKKIKEIHNVAHIDYNINEIERQSKVIRKLCDDKYELQNELRNIKYRNRMRFTSGNL